MNWNRIVAAGKISSLYALLLLAFLFMPPAAFSKHDFLKYYIEGTAYDAAHPENSVAVINGDEHKIGDEIGEYRLVEIYGNAAVLEHVWTGKQFSLFVGQDGPPPWVMNARLEAGERQASGAESTPGPAGLMETVSKAVSGETPSNGEPASEGGGGVFGDWMNMINFAWEASLLVNLNQIRMGLEIHNAEYGEYPKKLSEIVEKGYIQGTALSNTGSYVYRYKSAGGSYDFWADPDTEGKRHFYMSEDGVVRAEADRSANKNSRVATQGLPV